MDGKLYIIITDQPEITKTETITTEEKKPATVSKNDDKKTSASINEKESTVALFAKHQFFEFMKQTATEAVNWSISNIGNFTGDYVKQSNIQNAVNLGNKLAGIGMSIAAGASIGGPVGALITGTIAVVGTAVNTVLSDISNSFQVKKQNREIAQLRELSGLNPLTNGGRI